MRTNEFHSGKDTPKSQLETHGRTRCGEVDQKQKREWKDRVERMGQNRLPKNCRNGRPEGKRPRGRPPKMNTKLVLNRRNLHLLYLLN